MSEHHEGEDENDDFQPSSNPVGLPRNHSFSSFYSVQSQEPCYGSPMTQQLHHRNEKQQSFNSVSEEGTDVEGFCSAVEEESEEESEEKSEVESEEESDSGDGEDAGLFLQKHHQLSPKNDQQHDAGDDGDETEQLKLMRPQQYGMEQDKEEQMPLQICMQQNQQEQSEKHQTLSPSTLSSPQQKEPLLLEQELPIDQQIQIHQKDFEEDEVVDEKNQLSSKKVVGDDVLINQQQQPTNKNHEHVQDLQEEQLDQQQEGQREQEEKKEEGNRQQHQQNLHKEQQQHKDEKEEAEQQQSFPESLTQQQQQPDLLDSNQDQEQQKLELQDLNPDQLQPLLVVTSSEEQLELDLIESEPDKEIQQINLPDFKPDQEPHLFDLLVVKRDEEQQQLDLLNPKQDYEHQNKKESPKVEEQEEKQNDSFFEGHGSESEEISEELSTEGSQQETWKHKGELSSVDDSIDIVKLSGSGDVNADNSYTDDTFNDEDEDNGGIVYTTDDSETFREQHEVRKGRKRKEINQSDEDEVEDQVEAKVEVEDKDEDDTSDSVGSEKEDKFNGDISMPFHHIQDAWNDEAELSSSQHEASDSLKPLVGRSPSVEFANNLDQTQRSKRFSAASSSGFSLDGSYLFNLGSTGSERSRGRNNRAPRRASIMDALRGNADLTTSRQKICRQSIAINDSTGVLATKGMVVHSVVHDTKAMNPIERRIKQLQRVGDNSRHSFASRRSLFNIISGSSRMQSTFRRDCTDAKQYRLASKSENPIDRYYLWSLLCSSDREHMNTTSVGFLNKYLSWTFRTSFMSLVLSFCLLYFVCVTFFACILYWAHDEPCILYGGEETFEELWFIDAFALSWTTFSTVGYGIIHPRVGMDIESGSHCMGTNIFTAVIAFTGVLTSALFGSIFFSKVDHVLSIASIQFSDPIVIRYGSGVSEDEIVEDSTKLGGSFQSRGSGGGGGGGVGKKKRRKPTNYVNRSIRQTSYRIGSNDMNGDENNIYSEKKGNCCPVLEFRIANQLSGKAHGEIINATVNVLACTDAQDAVEAIELEADKLRKQSQRSDHGRVQLLLKAAAVAGANAAKVVKNNTSKTLNPKRNFVQRVRQSIATMGMIAEHEFDQSESNVLFDESEDPYFSAGVEESPSTVSFFDGSSTNFGDTEKEKEVHPLSRPRKSYRSSLNQTNHDSLSSINSSFKSNATLKNPYNTEKVTEQKVMRMSLMEQAKYVASTRCMAVLEEPSDDNENGQYYSRLDIETNSHPSFKRVWVIRHLLNEFSPILSVDMKRRIRENNGYWPESLCNHDVVRDSVAFHQLIIYFTGTQDCSGSTVRAFKVYEKEDLVVGYSFVDMCKMKIHKHYKGGRKLEVDMNLINAVEEQEGGGGEPLDYKKRKKYNLRRSTKSDMSRLSVFRSSDAFRGPSISEH